MYLAANVNYEVVFLYTKTTLPLRWRVAGTWASREGSLLLWSAMLAIVTALMSWSHAKAPASDAAEQKGRQWTRAFLIAFTTAFLAAVVWQKTFEPTPAFFLQGRPYGNGLNPTLKSPFILIHPPLMFVAYALATVPAAAVLGHLISGTNRWGRIGLTWARIDWLVYTFAMGLGGMWAYYTLGFGGYWAWDPVEVANLLPWLALTVYMHAQLHNARYGSYQIIGPFLGLLPFLFTLFSTLSTRSGLWVSVHAFTDPTNTFNPDGAARFLDILAVESSLLVYVSLFLATLGLGLALWCIRLSIEYQTLRRTAPVIAGILAAVAAYTAIAPRSALSAIFELSTQVTGGRTGLGLLAVAFVAVVAAASPALSAPHAPTQKKEGSRITLRSLAAYSVVVLGLGLLVLFLFHMAAVNGWNQDFYEARIPILAAPTVLGLFVLQAHSVHGRKRSVLMAAGLAVAALIAALVAPDNRGGWALLVLCVPLVIVSLDRVRRAALPSGIGKRERLGPTLLWLGALLDLLFWLNPPSNILGLQLVWPTQLVVGAFALYAVWGSHRILAGAAPRAPVHVYFLVAILGGFFVAPVLAIVAFMLLKRSKVTSGILDLKARARLRQAALYGVHLALAIALLGYTTSTYWKETTEQTVVLGETAELGQFGLTFERATLTGQLGSPFANDINLIMAVSSNGPSLTGNLHFEPDVGAYFPLPATHRAWNGDLYLNVHDVHIAQSACADNRTISAYQAAQPPRACTSDRIDQATIEVTWLPGLGLVWLALALFVAYMAVLAVFEPRRATKAPVPPSVPGDSAS